LTIRRTKELSVCRELEADLVVGGVLGGGVWREGYWYAEANSLKCRVQ
jgi:hypothetical protein